ncbi:HAD family hydrolase [Megalodesulfovibrio gigas]|nr:HAD family hydrolase [Megalodesulfovibrio gigas]
MDKKSVAAALFDVDGVLVDSKAAYLGFYNDVLAHVGLPPMTAAEEVQIFSFTFEDGFNHLIPPPLRPRGRQYIDATRFEDYLPRIRPMPGALDTLARLRAQGLKLGVCTNGARREVDVVFGTYGIAEQVHAVVTCNEAPRPKPHPDGLLLLLEMLDVPREAAVYIGDSPVDEQAARAAGLEFWSFRSPALQAARLLQHHGEVLEALLP